MDPHVEVELKGGGTVRVAGDVDGFLDQLQTAPQGVSILRFEEIPNGNSVWINPDEIAVLREGRHPRVER
jgi:hypothetical protein